MRLSRADGLTKLVAFKAKESGIAGSQATYRLLFLGYDGRFELIPVGACPRAKEAAVQLSSSAPGDG